MADPTGLEKLSAIEGKLRELAELGKELAKSGDHQELQALQAQITAVLRAFNEQVRGLQSTLVAKGLVKPIKYRIDLEPAEVASVKERTGREVTFVELDEPPPRALTREELVELALKKARE
jgi:hypothetical protein